MPRRRTAHEIRQATAHLTDRQAFEAALVLGCVPGVETTAGGRYRMHCECGYSSATTRATRAEVSRQVWAHMRATVAASSPGWVNGGVSA
jgi:hypothetical protein